MEPGQVVVLLGPNGAEQDHERTGDQQRIPTLLLKGLALNT